MMKNVVLEQINKKVVLPNRVSISLVKEWELDEDIVALQNPRPESVFRIRIKSANNLPVADVQWAKMFGLQEETSKKGGSDPYVIIRVGAQSLRTPTVRDNLNPEWEKETATFDFFLYNVHQEVEFDLFDDDFGMSEDDFLVGTKVLIKDLLAYTSHNLTLRINESLEKESLQVNGTEELPKSNAATFLRQETCAIRVDDESLDSPSLDIDVCSFSLVPCTLEALKEIQSFGVSPNEALLGVSVYGLGPIGSRKNVEDVQDIHVQMTVRRQNDSQKILTKKPQIRMQYPTTNGVDKHSMKVVQNMKFMHPDLHSSRIADVVGTTSDVVDKILSMKRLLPLIYNQAFYLFVESCGSDTLVIELMAPPPGGKKPTLVISSIELPVCDIALAEGSTITKSFVFREEVDTDKSTARPQEYELLLKLQMWAFKLDKLGFNKSKSRSSKDPAGTLVS